MIRVTDQRDDLNGQRLFRICQLYGQPEYVKQASLQELRGDKELPGLCFADQIGRRFPQHTKAATWVSYGHLLELKDKLEPNTFEAFAERLKEAAVLHNISADLADMDAENVKLAAEVELKDSDYAVVFDRGDGDIERHYPLRNAKEVKAAAEYLRNYRDALPYAWRYQIATKILEKAAAYGADIRDQRELLEKQAGKGWCAAGDVAKLLQDRAILLSTRNPELASELRKAAQSCFDHPVEAREPDKLISLAHQLDEIDRTHSLNHDYGEGFQRPEDVLFSITLKTASAFTNEHFATSSGTIYRLEDMQQLQLGELADLFGDEFVEKVAAGGLMLDSEKLASQAGLMSPQEAELFDRLLRQHRIEPVASEPAHQGSWLTPEVLAQLAAE